MIQHCWKLSSNWQHFVHPKLFKPGAFLPLELQESFAQPWLPTSRVCRWPSPPNPQKTEKKQRYLETSRTLHVWVAPFLLREKNSCPFQRLESTLLLAQWLFKQHPLVPSCCLTTGMVFVDTRWFSSNTAFLFCNNNIASCEWIKLSQPSLSHQL